MAKNANSTSISIVNDADECSRGAGKPRARKMRIYWGGTPGLKALAKRGGHPLMKVGCDVEVTPQKRMTFLSAAGYGAFRRDLFEPSAFYEDDGYSKWAVMDNYASDFANIPLDPHVKIENGVFEIELPDGVDPRAVDGAMRTELADLAIHHWCGTLDGAAFCHKAEILADDLKRYSFAPKTGKYVPVMEIYALHPRRDRELFARILAKAIAWASRKTVH